MLCLNESDDARNAGGSPAFQEEVLVAVGFLLVFDAEPGGLQPVTSLVPDRKVVVAPSSPPSKPLGTWRGSTGTQRAVVYLYGE